MTTYWAAADARRLHRRIQHLAHQPHPPSDTQVAYLRRQTMTLLLDDDAELPAGWVESLRELERILHTLATELNEEAA